MPDALTECVLFGFIDMYELYPMDYDDGDVILVGRVPWTTAYAWLIRIWNDDATNTSTTYGDPNNPIPGADRNPFSAYSGWKALPYLVNPDPSGNETSEWGDLIDAVFENRGSFICNVYKDDAKMT